MFYSIFTSKKKKKKPKVEVEDDNDYTAEEEVKKSLEKTEKQKEIDKIIAKL